jgi:hypothetical protein
MVCPFPSAYLRDIELPQAIKDVSSNPDGLVDLFNSIGILMVRLDICTRIEDPPTVTEIVFKIMAELMDSDGSGARGDGAVQQRTLYRSHL